MILVLTCCVHDAVYQVCKARRGLVRQQVGEKIPEARRRQSIQRHRETDKPHQIFPTEHDFSHSAVIKTLSIKLSKI